MGRCQMVRVFRVGADATPERCIQDTYHHDDEFCYACTKYANGTMTPLRSDSENGESCDRDVRKLYHVGNHKVFFVRED